MSKIAKKTDPGLWDKVKEEVIEGDKGGKPGQWSARKAQLASSEYKKEGGGYEGSKRGNQLQGWTDEHWGTKSGGKSGDTGERYLPEKARAALTDEEYERTTAKKRADTRKGRQFSSQPREIARKTADAHGPASGSSGKGSSVKGSSGGTSSLDGLGRAELLERARRADVKGRSRMTKAELIAALR